MNLKLIYSIAVPLLIILHSLSVIAQDYEIHLEPTSKAGDKYSLSATGSQRISVKLTSGNEIIRNTDEEFTLELIAEATVLAVDAKGRATSKSFTITSTKLIKDGTTKSLLPAGSVILAKLQDGNTLFEMNGKPVEKDVATELSVVIALHSGNSISDEAMFGSQIRRRVGETWGLNLEAVMPFIKELGAPVRKEDITGAVTLEKVENNHLFVRGSMDVANALLPLSSDFRTDKGEFHSKFYRSLPLPNSDGSIEERHRVLMNLTGTGRADTAEQILRLNMIVENSGTFKTIPAIQ